MSKKLLEGLWDCPYCETKGIGGLTKHCPECGHPQDRGTRFYMGGKKHYLSEDEADKVGTAPDWVCDYCTSLNNAKYIYCRNCGARRENETKDYFSDTEKEQDVFPEENCELEEEPIEIPEEPKEKQCVNQPLEHPIKQFIRQHISYIAALLVIMFGIVGLVVLFSPKYVDVVVSQISWEREIEIEEYRTVTESDWTIPSGGRLLYSASEIRSYDTVLDHYETKTRTVTEQVLDGYDTNIYYSDNGNGTFTEHTSQTPRYRTETRLETYQEPVYTQVPVYDTKYYYEIERWKYDRSETSSGINDSPYWAEYILDDNERISNEKEVYAMTFVDEEGKEYDYTCTYEEWMCYELAENVEIKVSAGFVIEITN